MQKRFNILIIDDNRELVQNLTDILDANGFRTAVASDGHSAQKICRKRQFDLALVDIKLPDIDGLRLVEKLTELRPEIEYIIITGHGSLENAVEAVRQRKIAAFEIKPLDMSRILVFIRQIAERKKAEDKLRHYKEQLEEIVVERTSELRKTNQQLREEIKVRKRTEQALQESETKFRSITASAKDAIIMLNNEGNISYWNKAAKKIFGYSGQEALGKESHIFLGSKRNHTNYRKGFSEFKKSGKGPVIGKTLELVAVKKDRKEFPVELSVSAVKLKGKWNAIGILRDITERKKTEEALRDSEEKYKTLVESAVDFIYMIDKNNRVLSLNKAAVRLLRKKPKDIIGKSIFELFPKNIATGYSKNLKEVFKTSKPGFYESKMIVDGTEFWISVSLSPVTDKEGKITSVMGVTRDITDLKQAEEEQAKALAAAAAAKMAEETIEGMTDSVVIGDLKGRIIQFNKAFSENFGWGKEAIGKLPTELVVEEDISKVRKAIKECLDKGKIINFECAAIAKDKKKIPVLVSATLRKNSNGKSIGLISTIKDITECKRAEEELENIFKLFPDMVAVCTTEGKFLKVNPSWEKVLGYTTKEILDMGWAKLVHPDDVERTNKEVEKQLKGSSVANFVNRYKCKDGSFKTFEWQATFAKEGIVHATARDITDRKLAEEKLKEYSERLEEMVEARTKELRDAQEKLIRGEKLAILGQLAGGVGHELRNPLGAIKNAAYFLKIALEKPEQEVKETLDLLEKEVSTSERIISSLLGFARPKPPSRHKVDVQEVIDKVVLRTAIPEGIKIVTQSEKEMPHILADSGQLSQIFGNIVLNSIQAMPEGGKLVIESRLDNEKQIAISFTDTGEGIPKEIIRKLFEPLFTTKTKGVGLGLAVTKSLVEGHGGTIKVKSKVGIGSTFIVKLPASTEPKVANMKPKN